ncbi:MAG: hypothetical protein ACK55O_03645 [Phycisphaerales bacterium]|jgi:hypothetical protein|nr:hypothetical protein [Phycisphaeraceae bacterium]
MSQPNTSPKRAVPTKGLTLDEITRNLYRRIAKAERREKLEAERINRGFFARLVRNIAS